MTAPRTPSVRHHVVVSAPIERAFAVVTERFGDFKPREHNLLTVPIAETVFERQVGGHIYDRGVDDSVCRWARVLVYEPPGRVVFSWDIGPTWQPETDQSRTSEVEVRFTPASGGRTGSRWPTASTATRAGRCTWIATHSSSALSGPEARP